MKIFRNWFKMNVRPIMSVEEVFAHSNVKRAKRLDPTIRIDKQPLQEAVSRWYGRVLE